MASAARRFCRSSRSSQLTVRVQNPQYLSKISTVAIGG
jgi:hypothetical protein